MKLILEKRPSRSAAMALASPFIALALTVFTGGVLFYLRGLEPLSALYVYFIEPLMSVWSLEELAVKVIPLVLIGVGLAIGYKANVWNIGAEGQFVMGAVAGAIIPVYFSAWQSPLVLVLMLAMGMLGGALYGAIPAVLKNRFGVNEILSSLMLVYVAQLFLDWLVRGPWRDPHGYNFPKSITFEGWQLLPTLGLGRVHIGIVLALLAVILTAILMARTLKGFEVRVIGLAPRAGAFSGFSRARMVMFSFLLTGALAGLAGIGEVAGPIGQLQPNISPGYGFAAIIVAFLGRLNPVGVLFAAIMLGISYLGGEALQVSMGVSSKISQVFQGILLFFVLACDTLILYRVRILRSGKIQKAGAGS